MSEHLEQQASTPDHRRFTYILRRGWIFLVAGVAVGLAAGAVLTAAETARYTATASVLVTPTGVGDTTTLSSGRTSSTINMDTEAQLATSADVANLVHTTEKLGRGTTVDDLSKNVAVTVPPNTEVLQIQYEATSASLAAQRANDFANAYLAQRKADAEAGLTGKADKATSDLAILTGRLKVLTASIAKLRPASSDAAFQKSQRASLIGQINSLNRQLTSLSTTVVTPGKVITTAQEPSAPSSPSTVLNLGGGLAAGLLLGLFAAWLRTVTRRRIRREDDVTNRLHLPVLGTIEASENPDVVSADSTTFQAYRRLSNVVASTLDQPGVVLVTGECTQFAIAAVAANLTRALAKAGATAVTTSTDAEVTSRFQSDEAMQGAVATLPTGATLDGASLQSVRGAGYLVIAAPDPRGSADAQTVATHTDAALLVVEAGTRSTDIDRVLEQLDAVGTPVAGAVLVPSRRWWARAARIASSRENAAAAASSRRAASTSTGESAAPAKRARSTKGTHGEPRRQPSATENRPSRAPASSSTSKTKR